MLARILFFNAVAGIQLLALGLIAAGGNEWGYRPMANNCIHHPFTSNIKGHGGMQ